MDTLNDGLRKDVEKLKSARIIRKDKEIAVKTGFHKSVISNYLSGRVEASKAFIDKFYEVFKNDLNGNNVSKTLDTIQYAQVGDYEKRIVKLESEVSDLKAAVIKILLKES